MENRSSRTNQDACSMLSSGSSASSWNLDDRDQNGSNDWYRGVGLTARWFGTSRSQEMVSGNCPSLRSIKVPISIQAMLRTKHSIQSMPNSRKAINNWQICCLSSTLH